MECDYSAGDECKEGDGGTLLEAGEEAARSLDESPLQIDEGQRAIWGGCQTLSKRRPVLIDAPVGALSLCAGAPLAFSRPPPRVDSAGKPTCELCGRRLADVKHHHPPGRTNLIRAPAIGRLMICK